MIGLKVFEFMVCSEPHTIDSWFEDLNKKYINVKLGDVKTTIDNSGNIRKVIITVPYEYSKDD